VTGITRDGLIKKYLTTIWLVLSRHKLRINGQDLWPVKNNPGHIDDIERIIFLHNKKMGLKGHLWLGPN
jgi:hypothetical protein